MVMQSGRRVLTVEEVKRLPPPSPALVEQRRRAIEEMLEIRERAIARLGRLLTEAEMEEILDRNRPAPSWLDDPSAEESADCPSA